MLPRGVLAAAVVLFAAACSSGVNKPAAGHAPTTGVSVTTTSAAARVETLRDLAQRRGIAVGSAAEPTLIASDPRYGSILGSQFNMVSPENVMKWPAIHPEPTRYDFSAADALVTFAEQHHMAVRGHNLLTGGNNTASWVLNSHFTRNQLTAVVQQHITTVVSHYRGRVAQWDVVNEPLDFRGQLEANVWSQGIGPDYMDLAFRWAHAADPQALLFYNEDDIACDVCAGAFPVGYEQHRDDAIYNLVAGMKQRGVPIDGVGLQMHLWAVPPDHNNVTGLLERLRRLGVQVAITEMDVRLPDTHTAADLDRQAEVYANVLSLCLAAPNCRTFVVWEFSDAVSWVPKFIHGFGSADIYDTDYRPKPAYYALLQVLRSS